MHIAVTTTLNRSCDSYLQRSSGSYSYDDCVTIAEGVGNDKNIISPLIDNEMKRVLELYINVIGFIVTSLLGIFCNVVNIVVYWKQGLCDSITLGFFALSVSDLILVAMPLCTGSTYAVKYILQDSPIDFSSIHYVSFGWVRNFTYSCSLLITAYLSLERCCCIVLPFKVQTLFTKRRTVLFLVALFLFHAICLGLLPAIVQLEWQLNSLADVNSTKKLRVKFSDFGREMEVFYSTSMSFIVPVGCQVIVTVCAFVMVRALRKASRFRAQATSAGHSQGESVTSVSAREKTKLKSAQVKSSEAVSVEPPPPTCHESNPKGKSVKRVANDSNDSNSNSKTSTLSQRDARLVKTMVFLVSILSACNIPFLAATFAWRSVPDLNIGRPYQNTLSVIFSIVYILGNLNASANVFVYYKTSSRFREVAKGLFTMSKK